MTSEVKIDRPDASVFKEPAKALVFLAHGAGADMNHHFMEEVTQLLVKQNVEVVRFNFPYMEKRKLDGKRRPPDRMPKLLAHYFKVLRNVLVSYPSELPVFIAGKSMGGRVAASLMSSDESNTEYDNLSTLPERISGVICLGYPFHPPKKLEKLRLSPLQNTLLPVKIIQGDRDSLGNYDEIQSYDLPNACEVTYLPDGDHDFKPRVKSGYKHDEHIKTAVNEIIKFIDERLSIERLSNETP